MAVTLISGIGGGKSNTVNVTLFENAKGSEDASAENVSESDRESAVNTFVELMLNKVLGGETQDENKVLEVVKIIPGGVWLVLMVLHFFVYTPFILMKSRNWFCDEVADYLIPEMERFLKETDFRGRTAEKFEILKTETERAYQEILLSVLDKTEIPVAMQIRSEKEEFAELCVQWETIKKLV